MHRADRPMHPGLVAIAVARGVAVTVERIEDGIALLFDDPPADARPPCPSRSSRVTAGSGRLEI
eukprot:2942305-Pyramimonas_sp.AAC.1